MVAINEKNEYIYCQMYFQFVFIPYSGLIIGIQWFHYWDTVVSLLGYSGFIIRIQWFHYWNTEVLIIGIQWFHYCNAEV